LSLVAAQPAAACGLALALTVDVSGSISAAEYRVQMEGLAEALLAPEVRRALVAEQAALAVIQWSGGANQALSLPWVEVRDEAVLLALSRDIRLIPRQWFAARTAIGAALQFTARSFAQAPACDRRVIDISGDGRSNEGLAVAGVRDLLVRDGIRINAVAIEGAEAGVTGHFRDAVIGGPGAFVVTAEGYADYPRAIRLKLLAETAPPSS
jgi:Ca-activated chloride channel family protein